MKRLHDDIDNKDNRKRVSRGLPTTDTQYVIPYKKMRLCDADDTLTIEQILLINRLPGHLRVPLRDMVARERERISGLITAYRRDMTNEAERNKTQRAAYQKRIDELTRIHRTYYEICVPYIVKKYAQITRALCQHHGRTVEAALIKTPERSMAEWRRKYPAGVFVIDQVMAELHQKGWTDAKIEWRDSPDLSYIYLICDLTDNENAAAEDSGDDT